MTIQSLLNQQINLQKQINCLEHTEPLLLIMVHGVTEGFEKKLELQGVGYRCQVQGKSLILSVGYSHQITIPAPEGINISVEAIQKLR